MTELFFGLRIDRTPVAVVCYEVVILPSGCYGIHFGLATRNPRDVFSKTVARTVAKGRMALSVDGLVSNSDKPYDHRIAVRRAIIANRALPQPARQAAADWFQTWPQRDRRRGDNRISERRKLGGVNQ